MSYFSDITDYELLEELQVRLESVRRANLPAGCEPDEHGMRTWLPHYPGEGPIAAYARNSAVTDCLEYDGRMLLWISVQLGMSRWTRSLSIETPCTDAHFLFCWDSAMADLIRTAVKGVSTGKIPENARPLSAYTVEVLA